MKSVSSPGAELAGNRTRTTCERLRSEVREVDDFCILRGFGGATTGAAARV
nr:MAG TPA: hypothetical protein [Caudoviricetes sp.]